jgi:hypothetical protein
MGYGLWNTKYIVFRAWIVFESHLYGVAVTPSSRRGGGEAPSSWQPAPPSSSARTCRGGTCRTHNILTLSTATCVPTRSRASRLRPWVAGQRRAKKKKHWLHAPSAQAAPTKRPEPHGRVDASARRAGPHDGATRWADLPDRLHAPQPRLPPPRDLEPTSRMDGGKNHEA